MTSRQPCTDAIVTGLSAGLDTNFGFQAYGPRWRHHRRAFWQQFTQNAILRYQQAQRVMAHKFLFKLLQDPARLKEHIR